MTEALDGDPASSFGCHRQMRLQRAGLDDDLEQPALANLLPPVIGAEILEIECGAGTLARLLAHWGVRHVVGIDPSPRMPSPRATAARVLIIAARES